MKTKSLTSLVVSYLGESTDLLSLGDWFESNTTSQTYGDIL